MRVIIKLNQEEQAGTAIQIVPTSTAALIPATTLQAGPNGQVTALEMGAQPVLTVDEVATDAGPPSAALLRAVDEGIPLMSVSGFMDTNGYTASNGAAG